MHGYLDITRMNKEQMVGVIMLVFIILFMFISGHYILSGTVMDFCKENNNTGIYNYTGDLEGRLNCSDFNLNKNLIINRFD